MSVSIVLVRTFVEVIEKAGVGRDRPSARARLRSGLAWMALSLLLVVPRTARADADLETIRVIYQAPAECPGADAFVADVRRATPRARLTDADDPVRLFRVEIQAEPRARGRLTITEDGTLIGSRDVEGATCEEVSRVLAFAVALAIESRADRPPERVATPFVAPGPAPARAESLGPPSVQWETTQTSSQAWWGSPFVPLPPADSPPTPPLAVDRPWTLDAASEV